jgi:hypothetical protein
LYRSLKLLRQADDSVIRVEGENRSRGERGRRGENDEEKSKYRRTVEPGVAQHGETIYTVHCETKPYLRAKERANNQTLSLPQVARLSCRVELRHQLRRELPLVLTRLPDSPCQLVSLERLSVRRVGLAGGNGVDLSLEGVVVRESDGLDCVSKGQ